MWSYGGITPVFKVSSSLEHGVKQNRSSCLSVVTRRCPRDGCHDVLPGLGMYSISLHSSLKNMDLFAQ